MTMREEPQKLVEVGDLYVGYGGQAILPPLRFTIGREEFWALVGRNGSGKTTLLRTILGLLPRVGGTVVRGDGVRIGYVPQRDSVDLSVPGRVIDVVKAGLDRGWSFSTPFLALRHREQVQRAMRDAQVQDLAHRQYASLSEGQKQRVLMARVLSGDPQLLILDEPTSAMDVIAEHEVFMLLDNFREERKLAVIVVSHHLQVVGQHATHVVMVSSKDGLAFSGTVPEAMENRDFVERYGHVFSQEGCVQCGDDDEHEGTASADGQGHAHAHAEHDHEHDDECASESEPAQESSHA